MNEGYSLLDGSGKTIFSGTQEQVYAYLKHDVSDGRYRIVGPDMKFHCIRCDGIVGPDPDGVCLKARPEGPQ